MTKSSKIWSGLARNYLSFWTRQKKELSFRVQREICRSMRKIARCARNDRTFASTYQLNNVAQPVIVVSGNSRILDAAMMRAPPSSVASMRSPEFAAMHPKPIEEVQS